MKAHANEAYDVRTGVAVLPDHDAIIVGAGVAGLCSAIQLDAEGFDWVIFDRQDNLGGTWWQNRYPGVGVDTATQGYCYSFAQDKEWTRSYPAGGEIVDYLEEVAERYGLRDRIRFNTEVASAEWDDEQALWTVTLDSGERLTARHLVGAWGIYTRVNDRPDIPGLEDFEGDTVHTAKWPDDARLEGRKVGVIGTGASAVQVVPAIAPDVEHLTVFQRTAVWVTPRPDFPIHPRLRPFLARFAPARLGLRWGFGAFSETIFGLPLVVERRLQWMLRAWEALGRLWLRLQVKDPEVRRQLQPTYSYGCRRPTLSNSYFRTFNRCNVTLVTAGIERVTPRGIRSADGTEHELDVIVLGTGFHLWKPGCTPPIPVRNGIAEDLGVRWAERGYRTYRGVSVHGYPNLWITGWGPQSLAGPSYTFMVESNVKHMMRCLLEARRRGTDRIEVRQKPFESWSNRTAKTARSSALFNPSCRGHNSFWVDHHGDGPIFRPTVSVGMWVSTRTFSLDDYEYAPATGPREGSDR